MRIFGISAFLALFFGLLGLWIGKTFLPTVKTVETVRAVLEVPPPEIIERIQYDTLTVEKWKTKIVYRNVEPEEVLEIPRVELDTLRWAILALEKRRGTVKVDAYSPLDKRLLSETFKVRNDFQVRLNQHSKNQPIILLESRDFFSLTPHLYVSYNTRMGPEISIRGQRIWRIEIDWVADQDGFYGRAGVKIW